MHSTEEQKHRRPGAWHGVKVAALACKVEQALAQVEVGVDVIVAQGTEAAGHTGEVASMVLWQMAAALALGTQALGTGRSGSPSNVSWSSSRSGREGRLRAGEDGDADVGVRVDHPPRIQHAPQHLRAERVAGLGRFIVSVTT